MAGVVEKKGEGITMEMKRNNKKQMKTYATVKENVDKIETTREGSLECTHHSLFGHPRIIRPSLAPGGRILNAFHAFHFNNILRKLKML